MIYLYKLKFTSPVHFGSENPRIGLEKTNMAGYADTLFSALCHEAVALYGEEVIKNLLEMTFTDLLPYCDDHYYIPKPLLPLKGTQNKELKKLAFIRRDQIQKYLNNELNEKPDFGKELMTSKVALPRDDSKENRLYAVSAFTFKRNCGLYFIVNLPQDFKTNFDKIVCALGLSGIGGKRGSGYGQFEVVEGFPKELKTIDENFLGTGEWYMNLSCLSPCQIHLDSAINTMKEGYYTIIPRNGFNYSTIHPMYKRKDIAMIKAGSCFKTKIKGCTQDIRSNEDEHPIYRYGKPLWFHFKGEVKE